MRLSPVSPVGGWLQQSADPLEVNRRVRRVTLSYQQRGTGSLLAAVCPLPVADEAGLALEVVLFYLVSLRRRADGREAGLSAMPSRSAAEQRAVIQRRAASADRERSVAFSHDLCEFSVWLFRSDSRVCPEETTRCKRKQNHSRILLVTWRRNGG